MEDTDTIVVKCPCCDATRAISAGNMKRIINAARLRHPDSQGGELDLTAIAEDIDLTGPLTSQTIAEVARIALKVDK